MIEIHGDLLENVKEGIIFHGCNCSGGFGSGFAGAVAKMYPMVRMEYYRFYSDEKPVLGDVNVVPVSDKLTIVNGFTQQDFGSDGKVYADLNAIAVCIGKTFTLMNRKQELNLPRIGSGLGGLSWETEVKPLFEHIESIDPYKRTLKVWYL